MEPTGLPPVRPEIRDLLPYIPGRSVADVTRELGLADVIKLAANENPLGPSPLAVAAAREALAQGHVYPEPASPGLCAALAARHGAAPEQVFVGNGSDEIFRLLAAAFLGPGRRAVAAAPSFPTYRRAARTAGATVTEVPLAADGGMDLPAMAAAAGGGSGAGAGGGDGGGPATLVFLCRPNNPTGGVFPAAAFPAFMDALPPGCLVVLDEAYHEYDASGFDGTAWLPRHPNLVVTRTFSKVHGLAGLRVGYGLAHPAVWRYLWTVREPFSVNAPAQAAALAALADRDHVARSVAAGRAGRAALAALAVELGLRCWPSEGNFALLELGRPARPVYEALLRRGIIVRPGETFGMPGAMRVTAGTGPELERFAGALRAALAAGG